MRSQASRSNQFAAGQTPVSDGTAGSFAGRLTRSLRCSFRFVE